MNQKIIKELSTAGRHQECLQACQQLLQSESTNPVGWKYAGKSLLALGQFKKAQQYSLKAHQLDNKDLETIQNLGTNHLKLNSTKEAMKWYERALEINRNYAPALHNLADLQRQAGNHQEAVDLFKRAIRANPQLMQAYKGGVMSLLALGDLAQAEEMAKQAIKINTISPGTNESLGIIFQTYKNTTQAIKYYEKELAINPRSRTSLFNLGLLLLQQGKGSAAIKPLLTAAAIHPSEQCSLLLAQAYQSAGQSKKAIVNYKNLGNSKSQNKIIQFNLGLCLLDIGNNIDAIEAFKLAVKLDDSFLPAWGNIGTALQKEGKNQEALLATQKVLELGPDNPYAHMNLGSIYKDLGNLDQALASTRKSLALKPDNPTAHMNLGNIYKDLGNLDQALASTLKSLELKPNNPDAHMNLAGIYMALGNLDQALASTLKSLELKPNNPDAHMNLAGIYMALGNLDQALASTRKSLALKPDNPTAHMNLGNIYKDLGNLDQALASTLKSLELQPDDPIAHIKLGSIYKELGNLDQALASTLKSLELQPDNPGAYINLGGIYMALGNLDQALASTLKSLELQSDNPTAHMNLAGIYKELGNLDQALTSTLKSLALKPDNHKAHMNLGHIYKEQKDLDQAKKSYEKAYEYKPTIENACLSKLNFPSQIICQEEVELLRSEYIKNARSIFEQKPPSHGQSFLDLSLFMLAYQNGNNDRSFLEITGKLVSPWLQIKSTKTCTQTDKRHHLEAETKHNYLPRVGFYFDNPIKEHVVFRHYFNIVKNCHNEGIEVVLIKGPNAAFGNSHELEKQASCVIQIQPHSSLEQSVETLKMLNLQMLIYTEIFSSPTPYCLAHNRIAPVQAVLPGNLITTGIPTIDYFFSSEHMETSTSQDQYSEQLIKLKGMPHGITEIPQIKHKKTRSDFNLPQHSCIFGLLHNLIKFHPDWDGILEKIAQNNEDARFILTGKGSKYSSFLKDRWRKSAPTFANKCIFFNTMPLRDYYDLLGCSDAVLDPIHMGCGTTSIDALSIGVPIITKPGEQSRTRIAYALYKIMGIKNAPIADTELDYINYCTELTSSKQKNIELKKAIKANYPKVAAASQESINQITQEIKRLAKPYAKK